MKFKKWLVGGLMLVLQPMESSVASENNGIVTYLEKAQPPA